MEKQKTFSRRKKVLMFCLISVFTLMCAGGGLVHWLNNSQTPQPSVNVANAAPTNSDSWNDAGNYSTTAPQGSGTEADPYLISTAEELAWISVYSGTASGKYFKQTANIDLGAHYWVPINNSSSSRAYYYDGDNHTISNLFIDTSVQTLSSNNYIGLFGRVYGSSSTHAYIKNLGIVGGSVSGEQYVGAVVGSAVYTDITSCYNEGVSVTGNNTYVGGITGSGSPMRCYNTGTVSSTSTSSSSYVGGITGSGSPTICYNSGDVSSSGGRVGGIAGSGSSELCYNTGNVFSAGDRVGGITGSGGVSGCYNLGSVTGVGDNVGGVSGYNDSYSSTAYSYYDSSAVTTSNSYGTPLSLQQMTVITEGIAPEAMKGFFISEWNFVEGQTPKPNMEGYDYGTTEMPVLQDPNSSNSESNPYLISSEANLAYLSANSSWAQDKYFLQTTNLDFSEYEYFVPINVDELYPGRYYYDGGNYAISNINIQTARNNVGLFGYTYDPYNEKAIYIKNIVLSNGNISGGSYVGGIVGEASRTNVKNCFNNGVTITAGGSYVGGIVGNGNNVNGCYNSGDVTSTSTSSSSYVGGITGSGSPTICYNSGDVSSSGGRVGGITGSGGVSGCYNLGSVTGVGEDVGGISGYGFSTVYSYYDSSVVANSNEYGTPLSLQQMTVTTNGVAPEMMEGFYETEWIFTSGQTPMPSVNRYGITEMPELQNPDRSNSSSNPYIINTEAKLAYLSEHSGWASNKYFLQTADLDFQDYECFIPIGIDYSSQELEYNYDGGHHTISNITIKTARNYVGIFSKSYGENINNLGIESGTIIGNNHVGSILGYAAGTRSSAARLTYCFNNANIYGNDYVGGIVGRVGYGAVTNSYNTGLVSGHDYVAGIVSKSYYSNIGTALEDCYNEGDITGNAYVGGIMAEVSDSSSIKRAYNTGNISGSSYVGGITGHLDSGTTVSCYSSAEVTGRSSVGAITGYIRLGSGSCLVNSYYNSELFTGNTKGIGLTLSEMTVTTNGVAPEEMKGFFKSEWIFTAGELPKLRMEDYTYGITEQPTLQDPSSSNAESNPYIIDNEAKLAYLSQHSSWASGKYFLQTANLDFSNYEYFVPINNGDSNYYRFYYDGGNYTISNIKIEISNDYVGLFGRVYGSSSNHSYIRNVHLVNSSVGGENYVGSIVGYGQYVDIINCSNNGTKVVGGSSIAGVAGYLENASVINCNNSADIFSTYSGANTYMLVGGLIANYQGGNLTVINSYNGGDVNSVHDYVYSGGIVGYIRVSGENSIKINITNCYNTGNIANNNNSESLDLGGIVGYIYIRGSSNTINISNCYNNGDIQSINVSGESYGGIVGQIYVSGENSIKINITNCYNTGNIANNNNSRSSYVGGIVGYIVGSSNTISVSNCYNLGDVSGTQYLGGIAGYIYISSGSSKTISVSNCYNLGDVSGTRYIGGIVGYISNYNSSSTTTPNIVSLSSCFNTGAVTLTSGSSTDIGGVVGYVRSGTSYPWKYVSIAWCYYNTDTVGSVVTKAIGYGNGYQCYGLTTAQMQGAQNENWMYLSNSYWNFASGEYPTLKYVAQPQN